MIALLHVRATAANPRRRGGWVCLAAGGKGIAACTSPQPTPGEALARVDARFGAAAAADAELARAARRLARFFAGKRVDFDFSFDLSGLPSFTRRVLCVVAGIPYGATRSYGWVARRAGSPRAARAVGQIMARNRLAPIVPCHRVVGGRGSPIGWGAGIDYRRRLLVMESVIAAQPRTGRARTTRRRS